MSAGFVEVKTPDGLKFVDLFIKVNKLQAVRSFNLYKSHACLLSRSKYTKSK